MLVYIYISEIKKKNLGLVFNICICLLYLIYIVVKYLLLIWFGGLFFYFEFLVKLLK